MTERETSRANVEAKRELVEHPERPLPHLDAVGRFLAGVAYGDTHRKPQPVEREKRPAEPAE